MPLHEHVKTRAYTNGLSRESNKSSSKNHTWIICIWVRYSHCNLTCTSEPAMQPIIMIVRQAHFILGERKSSIPANQT
jgi:hypothetical protein